MCILVQASRLHLRLWAWVRMKRFKPSSVVSCLILQVQRVFGAKWSVPQLWLLSCCGTLTFLHSRPRWSFPRIQLDTTPGGKQKLHLKTQ